MPLGLPGREAEGGGGVQLAGRNRLQPAPDDFRQIGGGEQHNGDQHPPQHVERHAVRKEQRQQKRRHEERRNQRDAPGQLDVAGEDAPQHRQLRAPPIGHGDPEGQRTRHARRGQEQREGQAAPQFGGYAIEAGKSAAEQRQRGQRSQGQQARQLAAGEPGKGRHEPAAGNQPGGQ